MQDKLSLFWLKKWYKNWIQIKCSDILSITLTHKHHKNSWRHMKLFTVHDVNTGRYFATCILPSFGTEGSMIPQYLRFTPPGSKCISVYYITYRNSNFHWLLTRHYISTVYFISWLRETILRNGHYTKMTILPAGLYQIFREFTWWIFNKSYFPWYRRRYY